VYYFSGALGSWVPGYLYEAVGWSAMIAIFGLILAFSAWSIGRFDTDCPAARDRLN
jgi:predicted MFS family arabinose efflux permease